MNKKTVTGRTPSQPELQSLKSEPIDDVEQFFIDVFSGKRAPVARGRFSAKSGQMQNIPRSVPESKGDMTGVNRSSFRHKNPQVQQIPREDLINMDFAVIEQRALAMHLELAAPYIQTEKDQSDDQ